MAAGRLDDEEAIFHIACLLLRDTAYLQLGGPDADGNDVTNAVSFLVLEAAHRLKIPANVGVCVGEAVDPDLLRRGVEIMLEDKTGMPKFLGVEQTADGFARNGYPLELGRQRAYSGCHWSAIPGPRVHHERHGQGQLRQDLRSRAGRDAGRPNCRAQRGPSVGGVCRATCAAPSQVIAAGLDFHMAHMHEVFPELVLDLLCYGPIETGSGRHQRRRRVLQPLRGRLRRWPRSPTPLPRWSSASSRKAA